MYNKEPSVEEKNSNLVSCIAGTKTFVRQKFKMLSFYKSDFFQP